MKDSDQAASFPGKRNEWIVLVRMGARWIGRAVLRALPDRVDLRHNGVDYLQAALSGLILRLAFPNADVWIVAWVAMVPLFWSLRHARGKGAFYRGWAFGFCFFYSISFFLNTLYVFVGVVVIGIVLMGVVAGLYGAVFGWGVAWLRDRFPRGSLLLIPAWWVVLEAIRSWGALAYPFGTLAHSQWSRLALIQCVAWTGVAGLSFLIVWFNLALTRLIRWDESSGRFAGFRAGGWKPATGAGVMVMAVLLGGAVELERQNTIDRQASYREPLLRTLMVQPSVPQIEKWDSYGLYGVNDSAALNIWDRMTDLTIDLTDDGLTTSSPHLIIWPETAIPDFYFNLRDRYVDRVIDQVDRWGLPLVMGANRVVREPGTYIIRESYNSAYLFVPGGGIADQHYDKIHLVPFGEDLTFLRFLPFADLLGLDEGAFDIGTESTVFHMLFTEDGVKNDAWFSILICFESTLPRLARDSVRNGARFLIAITNDAWFGQSSGPAQHHIQSVFRAVETRRWVIRCANHGITSLIAPTGRVVAQTALGEATTLSGVIVQRDDRTLYVRWGPWFAWLCALALAVAAGGAGLSAMRRRGHRRPV